MVRGTHIRLLVVASALVAAALPSAAAGSQLVDRNATGVQLAVNRKGEAMITYRVAGRLRRVLVWGGINARFPSPDARQIRLKKDYAGGWGKYRRLYWQGFYNACRPYDGPKLVWFVTGCKAPDGSYWALQSWQTPLPDFGYRTTRYGAPLDGFGRLLFLDTFNSRYGSGWRRENAFVAHNPTGMFCYGFYPFDPTKSGYAHPPGQTAVRGPGNGEQYRITVVGPGLTPDVMWTGPGLHDYDPRNPLDVAYERRQNALLDSMLTVDKQCRHH